MKRLMVFVLFFFFSPSVFAIGWTDLLNSLTKIYGVNMDIKNLDQSIADLNKGQLTDLDSISKGLTGTHAYGSMDYDRNQYDWGNGADSWQNLLSLYQTGGGGSVADTAGALAKQFPIKDNLGSVNKEENEYYRLQAQTSLASRASSQVAFNQVSHESRVNEKLQQEIDKTKDNKSAVDLNNRLAAEQNAMSIQQTKLLAVLVQQAAVDSQEKANHAKENAEFFDYKK